MNIKAWFWQFAWFGMWWEEVLLSLLAGDAALLARWGFWGRLIPKIGYGEGGGIGHWSFCIQWNIKICKNPLCEKQDSSLPECLAFASLNVRSRGKLMANLGKLDKFKVEWNGVNFHIGIMPNSSHWNYRKGSSKGLGRRCRWLSMRNCTAAQTACKRCPGEVYMQKKRGKGQGRCQGKAYYLSNTEEIQLQWGQWWERPEFQTTGLPRHCSSGKAGAVWWWDANKQCTTWKLLGHVDIM